MDLDLKRVLAARPTTPAGAPLNPLTTVWGDDLDVNHILDEHPRPLCEREGWINLNGWWDMSVQESTDAKTLWQTMRPPVAFEGKVLVPFSPEAALARTDEQVEADAFGQTARPHVGVGHPLKPTQLLWYRRYLRLERKERGHTYLLHFEAVDYSAAVYVNSVRVATHTGGYLPFDIDVTDYVETGANTLEVCVFDPSDAGTQPRGKQRLLHENMWYTGQSGIWQTVLMEDLGPRHIEDLVVESDFDRAAVRVACRLVGSGALLMVSVTDDMDNLVASSSVTVLEDTDIDLALPIEHVRLWSPDSPNLYHVCLTFGEDRVRSYCAFREVGYAQDGSGNTRITLNGRPLFIRGLLSQGYWPDGLMTAPSDEALRYDLEVAKALGFNCLRCHIKVERQRFYYHADRLGVLVIQDMVSGGRNPEVWRSANTPTLFRRTWSRFGDTSRNHQVAMGADDAAYQREWMREAKDTVAHLRRHPSIVMWVAFNESWGQFDSASCVEALRKADDTRPWVATSGWYDQGAGDVYAVHNYFRSLRVYPDPFARRNEGRRRAFMLNEFGGLTLTIEGHVCEDTVYGYDAYEDLASWRKGVGEVLAAADALEAQGASGFVYTQVSDIEEETNGILTYDRRVNKLLD
jgi:hypothetical protein